MTLDMFVSYSCERIAEVENHLHGLVICSNLQTCLIAGAASREASKTLQILH